MDTIHLFTKIAFLGMCLGFGFRLGWALLPLAERAIAAVLAGIVWLFLMAAHLVRKRLRV